MPRHTPPALPLAPSRILLATGDIDAADAVQRWQAHLDAGRLGRRRDEGPRLDYLKLDRLFARERVGIW